MSGAQGDIVVTIACALVLCEPEGSPPTSVFRGEPLPDNALDGELQRLAKLGILGRRRRVEGQLDEPPADDEQADGDGVVVAAFDIDAASVPDLAEYLETGKDGGKAFTIPEVLAFAEVEGDEAATAARARHLLEAEQHRSGGDARDGLTAGLAKLIEADPATPPAS